MAGENLPIISNRKLDIKSYVPEYLKYKSNGDFYEFIGVFEEYLNTMYINKTNSDQETLGILEKIESLKTLQDAWDIDFDYINHFAKFLGFQININTDDFSINIFGKPFAELDSDEQETIKKHVRQFVKTLPSWYRIKSTKNSVRAMLYSFGLVSDIIEKYTSDYNSTGVNWIDVPLDDVVTLPPGYYPTPHFGISIDVGNSSEIIRTPIPGCIPQSEITINSFESNNIGIIDSSGIEKKNIGGLGSINKFFGVAFRYTRNANNSYPTLIDVSDGTNKLLSVYQDQSVSYETVIEVIVGGSLKQFSTMTPFETLFPLGVEQTIHVSIDLTNPLAAPIMYLDGVEYSNGYDVVNNDSISSFPISTYDLTSSSDGSELSDLYWSSNSDFALLSSVAKYSEGPNEEEDNRPFYNGRELFTQISPDVVPVVTNSFIGDGIDGYIKLATHTFTDFISFKAHIEIDATPTGNGYIYSYNEDIPSAIQPPFRVFITPDRKIQVMAYGSFPSSVDVRKYIRTNEVIALNTRTEVFCYLDLSSATNKIQVFIDGVLATIDVEDNDPFSSLYTPTNPVNTCGCIISSGNRIAFFDGEISELYTSTNPLAITPALIEQYATSEEHFTQVAPDVVPVVIEPSKLVINSTEYNTKKIGDLEWMTENLSYANGSYMYPNNDVNEVGEYGFLYYYQTAVNLIPSGWRLPTKEDFEALISETNQTNTNAGKYLKEDASFWLNGGTVVNNDLGFSSRGAGVVWGTDPNNGYIPNVPFKSRTVFFTSTPSATGEGWYWCLNINDSGSVTFTSEWVTINNANRRNFSVRYVRDWEDSTKQGWIGGAVQGEVKEGWLGEAVQGEIEFEEDTCLIEEVIITDSTLPTWYNNITRLTDIVSQVKPINTVFDGFVSKFSVVPDFTDDQKIQIRAKVFPYYGSYAILSYKTQYLLDEGFGPININTYYLSDAGVDNIYADLENYVAIDGQII